MKKSIGQEKQTTLSYKKIFLIIIILLVIVAFSVPLYQHYRKTDIIKNAPPVEQITLTLFVPECQGKLSQKIVPVQSYSSERQKADIIIEQLRKGGYISDKIVLLDFAIDENGTLFVNFSKEIKGPSMATGEIIKIYSIVNSLLFNFKNAHKVLLLADGQPFYTPGGIIYTYVPLGFNQGLLED